MTLLWNSSFFDLLRNWYADSVFSDLFTFFRTGLYAPEFQEYKHFSIGPGSQSKVAVLFFAFTAGSILAAVWAYRTRNKLGKFVRDLLAAGATDEKSAKTLEELGYSLDPAVVKSLATRSELSIVVRAAEEEALKNQQFLNQVGQNEVQADGKKTSSEVGEIDPLTAHYFVPEDLRYRAENRFGTEGFTRKKLVLLIVLVLVISIYLCRFLPSVLRFADGILDLFA